MQAQICNQTVTYRHRNAHTANWPCLTLTSSTWDFKIIQSSVCHCIITLNVCYMKGEGPMNPFPISLFFNLSPHVAFCIKAKCLISYIILNFGSNGLFKITCKKFVPVMLKVLYKMINIVRIIFKNTTPSLSRLKRQSEVSFPASPPCNASSLLT